MQPTDPTDIAAKWGVRLESARCTLDFITQRVIRKVIHTSLSCRFRKNDRQFRYRRLRNNVFGEILIVRTNYKRGNKYSKVFVTNFGWAHVFLMDKKGGAHEALSLLFQRDGVPPKMIFDGSKDQDLGVFKRKVAEAGCHLIHMELGFPWQMAA